MKVVLLGDGNVGKTSLLISYNTDIFPQEYVPTIFDNYLATIKYNDYHVKMWLWYLSPYQGTPQARSSTNVSEPYPFQTLTSSSSASH